jgi:4,5:9,10-diseco-3-hydroxy-5,9,17-trioxoandrosta-1(10),2-diene-4-oate hydrolase
LVARAYDVAPILADAWRGFAMPESDLRPLAPSITCPTLFAWAARDYVIPLGRCLAAIQTFPNARIVKFPAGHAAHLETPDEFEDTLDAFLTALPKTTDERPDITKPAAARVQMAPRSA